MTRFLRVLRVTSPSQVSSQLFTSPSQVSSLYLCDLSATRVHSDSSFHLWSVEACLLTEGTALHCQHMLVRQLADCMSGQTVTVSLTHPPRRASSNENWSKHPPRPPLKTHANPYLLKHGPPPPLSKHPPTLPHQRKKTVWNFFVQFKVCYTQVSGPVQTTGSNTLSSMRTRHFSHTAVCTQSHKRLRNICMFTCSCTTNHLVLFPSKLLDSQCFSLHMYSIYVKHSYSLYFIYFFSLYRVNIYI